MFGKRGLPFLMGPGWQAQRIAAYNTNSWSGGSCSQLSVSSYEFKKLTSGIFGDGFGGIVTSVQGITTGNKLFLANPLAPLGGVASPYPCPPNIVDSSNDYSDVNCSNIDGCAFGALRTSGEVIVNGYDRYGHFGLGNTTDPLNPVPVTLTSIPGTWSKYVLALSNSAGIRDDGSISTCGYNLWGQLGIGDSTTYNTYQQVSSDVWIDIAISGSQYVGVHTLAIKSDYTVWSWGYNGHGELGLNDGVSRSVPYPVLVTPCSKIWAGTNTSAFLTTDGDLFVCGANNMGQIGLGGIYAGQNVAVPTLLVHHDDYQVIDVSFSTTGIIVLMENGDIWSSGVKIGTELFTASPEATLTKVFTYDPTLGLLPGAIWAGYKQSFVIPAANL